MDKNDRIVKAAQRQVKIHFVMMFIWISLIPPTLIWWKSSILWVLMISIYANIVGHWSAYLAAKAEKVGAENP